MNKTIRKQLTDLLAFFEDERRVDDPDVLAVLGMVETKVEDILDTLDAEAKEWAEQYELSIAIVQDCVLCRWLEVSCMLDLPRLQRRCYDCS